MKPDRQYRREFLIAMGAYVILLIISISVLPGMGDNPLRYGVAVLPAIPILFGMFAYIRYVQHIDELRRRIQLEALAFSVGVTGLLTFALGLLENVGGPRISLVWVFPALVFFWGIGSFLANRRYQ